jgi:glycosidase
MVDWAKHSTFYHIYPLGLCAAPEYNLGQDTAGNRLVVLYQWLDHIQELGCDALYLGPLFDSNWHGYDTSDYYRVDPRLGDNRTLQNFSKEVHSRGMKLVFDGVFNHVGRGFWAFRDLQEHGESSLYKDWFVNVDFSHRSPKGDAFDYVTWEGHHSLPKLNLHHPDVRAHLFDAVRMWMTEFQIDGLRLDAADCVEPFFWKELRQITKTINPEFWLMGEIIHGDYRRWANQEIFDSVTNYTAYKGLWSSFNDANFHEIAYTFDQQFGMEHGLFRQLYLYNFVDNHDVNRIASQITDRELLTPLYLLLFTMPGIPSIYYGSEFGVMGRKADGDRVLRQSYDLSELFNKERTLPHSIQNFARVRKENRALMDGDYRKLFTSSQQFAFSRSLADETLLVLLNAAERPVQMQFEVPAANSRQIIDLLGSTEPISLDGNNLTCVVSGRSGRIFKL